MTLIAKKLSIKVFWHSGHLKILLTPSISSIMTTLSPVVNFQRKIRSSLQLETHKVMLPSSISELKDL